MQMIMTRVAAVTILATSATRPGYGAISSRSQSQSHVERSSGEGKVCAIDAILLSADYNHGRLAHAKQVGGWILDTYANRIPRCKVDPIERPLHIR